MSEHRDKERTSDQERQNRQPPGGTRVETSDDLKGSERLPRRGNEDDKPASEQLGD